MKSHADSSIEQLRGQILRETSRSFYLSIRLLPKPLRDPIALAYLLARATDTIADTVEIEAALRLEELSRLAALIQASPMAAESVVFGSFAARQSNPAERALIEKIPDCLAWLTSLPGADQVDIKAVLAHINEGQALDVQRFSDAAELKALQNAAALDGYTYLVAGSVGEFWTRICLRHLPHFATVPNGKMLEWGVAYGKGLQLVNILRDRGADLRAGRCYLPADELSALGLAPADLREGPAQAEPIWTAWRERAEQGMAAGLEYACAIKPWRVRLATALPALIGIRTLALLRQAGARAFEMKVKVPRAEVRRILVRTIATLAAPRALRKTFTHLSS